MSDLLPDDYLARLDQRFYVARKDGSGTYVRHTGEAEYWAAIMAAAGLAHFTLAILAATYDLSSLSRKIQNHVTIIDLSELLKVTFIGGGAISVIVGTGWLVIPVNNKQLVKRAMQDRHENFYLYFKRSAAITILTNLALIAAHRNGWLNKKVTTLWMLGCAGLAGGISIGWIPIFRTTHKPALF